MLTSLSKALCRGGGALRSSATACGAALQRQQQQQQQLRRMETGSGVGLSVDQLEFQRAAETFARDELLPFSASWDEKHHFPVETLRRAAALGFGGVCVSEGGGGSGLGRKDAAVIFESLAYGDVPVTAFLSIHNMVASVIDRWGSKVLQSCYLPRLTSMDALASYCLTEPSSGSDAGAPGPGVRARPPQCRALSASRPRIPNLGCSGAADDGEEARGRVHSPWVQGLHQRRRRLRRLLGHGAHRAARAQGHLRLCRGEGR